MKIVEETSKFIAFDDNSKVMGELTFSPTNEKLWTIDYTHVNEEFRGQSVGSYLLDYVVEAARSKGVKIRPLCPFAKHGFQKNAEKYSDILY